jgi:predicted kinase
MSQLILMSGPSGCGKSTYAQKLSESTGAMIVSADSFFMEDGIYKFNPNRLGAAHANCYNKCYEELMASKSVIVDNTNTTWKEIEKYADLAYKYKAILHVYRPSTIDANMFINRNVHGVPKDAVLSMVNRFINPEDMKNKLQENYPNLVWGLSYWRNIL